MTYSITNPAVPLYGFQQRWLADRSRFKIGNICRQAGKSFMVALEVAFDAVESGDLWVLLSAGERQSKELMEKVKMHLEAMNIAAADIEEDFFHDTQTAQLTIRLPNGGRIIGLPANPDTARGFSGNVVLDEYAFHKNSFAIWKALFPTISRGYKIRVVTTPQGMGNHAHALITGDNAFSKHTVDIHQAVKDGVPHNIDELHEGINDDDAWNQEYLCLFIDDAAIWLTYDLIASCQDAQLAKEFDYDSFNLNSFLDGFKPTGPLYGGYDVGRKKDLSIFDLEELVGDVYWNCLTVKLNKVPFPQQRQFLQDVMRRLPIKRLCMDATGLGMQLAEEAKKEFGQYRVEEVTFTNPVKNDLAVRTRSLFEERRCRIPVCKTLRDDLHAPRKTVTAAGNVRFDAASTAIGHADRFWTKSLAFMAGHDPAAKPTIEWL